MANSRRFEIVNEIRDANSAFQGNKPSSNNHSYSGNNPPVKGRHGGGLSNNQPIVIGNGMIEMDGEEPRRVGDSYMS